MPSNLPALSVVLSRVLSPREFISLNPLCLFSFILRLTWRAGKKKRNPLLCYEVYFNQQIHTTILQSAFEKHCWIILLFLSPWDITSWVHAGGFSTTWKICRLNNWLRHFELFFWHPAESICTFHLQLSSSRFSSPSIQRQIRFYHLQLLSKHK